MRGKPPKNPQIRSSLPIQEINSHSANILLPKYIYFIVDITLYLYTVNCLLLSPTASDNFLHSILSRIKIKILNFFDFGLKLTKIF